MSERSSLPRDRGPRRVHLADGGVLDLGVLAADACTRYAARHPREVEEYGERWRPWCEHDMRHLLAWATLDAQSGDVSLVEQARWLADLLAARGYPAERVPDALLIAADVVIADVASPAAAGIVAALQSAADALGGPAPPSG